MILSTQTSFLFDKIGIDEGLKILASAGFDALDLSLPFIVREGTYFNGDDAIEKATELKKKAESLGLFFNQSHAPYSFDLKTKPFEEYTPLVTKAIKIAAAAGAKQIVVHPFHHIPYKGNEQYLLEKNIEYYRSFIPLCEETGIKVCVENMWQKDLKRGYIIEDVCSNAEMFAKYLDEIDSEWIIGCLDIGHCGLVGEEPEEAIMTLGHDRVKALHVHDNSYKADEHTIPGLGKINWSAVTESLAKIDYSGEFTYEADMFFKDFEPSFYRQAAKFLEIRGRHLISMIKSNLNK